MTGGDTYKVTSGENANLLGFGFNDDDGYEERRGRGGRGGRGREDRGGRDRGNKGGRRGGKKGALVIDEDSFPAL